jgi:hypothetical protein
MARWLAVIAATTVALVGGLLAQDREKFVQTVDQETGQVRRLSLQTVDQPVQSRESILYLDGQLTERLAVYYGLQGGVQPAPPVAHPDLPADAKEMLSGFDTDVAAIRKKAEEEVAVRRTRLIGELQQAQDRYTREAKLDEAVAIRDTIRRLKSAHLPVRPNPGSLYNYRGMEGEKLYFEVTGRVGGSLWGTDVYTGDSDLASAAVHAGALDVGQTGIVEVQIVPSPPQHVGSARHGANSSGWGAYGFSYTVKRWVPEK